MYKVSGNVHGEWVVDYIEAQNKIEAKYLFRLKYQPDLSELLKVEKIKQ